MEFFNTLQMQVTDSIAEEIHCHNYYEIIWVICGEGTYRDETQSFRFSENNLAVVNPFKNHAVLLEEESAAFRAYLPEKYLAGDLEGEMASFRCVPGQEQEENRELYDHIRVSLAKMAVAESEKKPFYEFQVQARIYDLIHTLLYYFSEKTGSTPEYKSAERLIKILQYIQENASKELSAEKVAAEFFLSPSYFSKLFKKEMHMSFLQYLTKIRLMHCAGMLENTKKPVSDICFENGFISIKQFQTAFKKQFGAPPTVYRNMQRRRFEKGSAAVLKEGGSLIEKAWKQIFQYANLDLTRKAEVRREVVPGCRVSMEEKTTHLKHTWKKILNVSNAYDVLNMSIQRSLAMAQEEIGFEYLHFHGILDDTMRVYYEKSDGTPVFNFHYIDQIIDFMLSVGLKPYLELGWMPKRLASIPDEKSLNGICHSKPKNINIWLNMVRAFVVHLIDKYAAEQVRTWMFQIWDAAFLPPWWRNSQEDFFDFYRQTYALLKKIIPEAPVGSPSVNPYGIRCTDWMENFMAYCKEQDCEPDFISLAMYPHESYNMDAGQELAESVYEIYMKVSPRENYMGQELEKIKQKLQWRRAGRPPVYITQWNMNNAPAFMLRDTLFGAAYLVKNLCENYDEAESFAYWFFSDEVEEYNLADASFHGGMGFIANNGLKKAAYQAMRLLARLDDELLAKGEYFFITKGDKQISVFLYSYVHYKKNCSEEEFRSSENRYKCFENVEKEFSVELADIPAGRYRMTEYILNREWGSSYDIWNQMGSPEHVAAEDLAYINAKALPQKKVSYLNLAKEYTVTRTLQMHEVRLIQFHRQD